MFLSVEQYFSCLEPCGNDCRKQHSIDWIDLPGIQKLGDTILTLRVEGVAQIVDERIVISLQYGRQRTAAR